MKDVCTSTCGDGIKVGTERCDDKNTENGDGYFLRLQLLLLDAILIVHWLKKVMCVTLLDNHAPLYAVMVTIEAQKHAMMAILPIMMGALVHVKKKLDSIVQITL